MKPTDIAEYKFTRLSFCASSSCNSSAPKMNMGLLLAEVSDSVLNLHEEVRDLLRD